MKTILQILGEGLKVLINALTALSAVALVVGVGYGIYKSVPPAEQVVAMENVRLKKACANGDQKACRYLQTVEGKQ